ncbi:conserved hypothetical protein [Ktedonobacter racemifer DSM 44963]|uniref:Uncharacterized protein n=1 Tax=Ktedonobacter racemifer DSM 44963 TaxID=485913 RepID=D6U8U1_KTERA|nr:conserved hypothetical protein [Ktedonobacter racemifer DSM 44963]
MHLAGHHVTPDPQSHATTRLPRAEGERRERHVAPGNTAHSTDPRQRDPSGLRPVW